MRTPDIVYQSIDTEHINEVDLEHGESIEEQDADQSITLSRIVRQPKSWSSCIKVVLLSLLISAIATTALVSKIRSQFGQQSHIPINQPLSLNAEQISHLSEQSINQILHQKLPMVNYIAPSQPNDFSLVIPSYRGHIDVLVKYLISMRTFCVECARLPVIVVTGNTEKPLFNERVKLNPDIGPYFSDLKFVTLPEITTLPWHLTTNQTGYWHNRTCDDSQGQCLRSKFLHQSLKKMYGCLHATTRFCWGSDSESLYVRPTTVKALLQDYMDEPFVVTHSWTKFNDKLDPVHSVVPNTMGIHNKFGRLLEYYMWVYDRSILAEVEQIIKQRIPTLEDFQPGWWMFIEVNYYAYILHNQRRFPQYRILDITNMFEWKWLEELSSKGFVYSPIEESRTVWENWPEFREGLIEAHAKFQLKAHKCSRHSKSCAEFLEGNPGVVVMLSEQPEGLFEDAMRGRFLLPHQAGYLNQTNINPGGIQAQ